MRTIRRCHRGTGLRRDPVGAEFTADRRAAVDETAAGESPCPHRPQRAGADIRDVIADLNGSRRKALTERFDLDTSKRARAYSRGNRQKVALIAALASDAELLLLDEPTAGLDPLMEATFRECVIEERRDGRAVLLSSHLLAEAEALAAAHVAARPRGTAAPHPPSPAGRPSSRAASDPGSRPL